MAKKTKNATDVQEMVATPTITIEDLKQDIEQITPEVNKEIFKEVKEGLKKIIKFEYEVYHLMQLVAEKKPFYLSQNSPKGNVIKPIDWDGKELTDDAYKLIKEKIGCRYLAFVDFEIGDCKGTIICDEEGLCKKLEKNDSASYLAKQMLVGDVIVGFPD